MQILCGCRLASVSGSRGRNLGNLVVVRLVGELVDVALALLIVWTGCEGSQVGIQSATSSQLAREDGQTGDLGLLVVVAAVDVAAIREGQLVRVVVRHLVVLELVDVTRALLAVHDVAHALDHLDPLLEADVARLEAKRERLGQVAQGVNVSKVGKRKFARRGVVLRV